MSVEGFEVRMSEAPPQEGQGPGLARRRETSRWPWLLEVTPRRVAGCALLFLLPQVAWFTYPSEHAATLAGVLGLDPFRVPAHPVWQMILAPLVRLPGLPPTVAASLFNAVCAVVTAVLLFEVGRRFRLRRSKSRTQQARYDAESVTSRQLAGLATALYALISLPPLIVFTRPHPLALTALMLVAALWLTQRCWLQPERRLWWAFCALYGLGCAESPTFFLLAPVFAVAWVWILWRKQLFTRSLVPRGLALFLAAYSVVLLACWSYYRSPVAEWRGFTHFGQVLHFFLLEQVKALRFSVPRVGWITITVLMLAPALSFLRSARDEVEDQNPRRTVLVLRALLAAMAFIPLFDGMGTPWRLTGPSSLLVTPYLITALWFGRLVSVVHWQLLQLPRSRTGRRSKLQRIGVPVLGGVLAVVAVVATVRHVWMANVWRARPLVRVADDLLRDAGAAPWLLTDGSLDAFLRLRAWDHGRELNLLNRSLGRYPPYLRYLSTRLPADEVRSVAATGLEPLLRVWGGRGTELERDLLVLDGPELWIMQGRAAWPAGLVFAGRRGSADDQAVSRAASNTWARLAAQAATFAAGGTVPPVEARYFRRVARHLGLVANNLGVFLEDAGRPDEAGRAYEQALAFDTNNASALCNLLGVRPDRAPEEQEELRERLRRVVKLRQAPPTELAGDYGFIRDPGAYALQALAWAAWGRTESAAERAEQALALAPTNRNLQLLLARIGQEREGPQSAELYNDILAREPTNTTALLGLARFHLDRQAYAEAEPLLTRLAGAGADLDSLAVERALLLVARDRRDEARRLLADTVRRDGSRMAAWLALALMAAEDGDDAGLAKAVKELQRAPTFAPGQLFLADLALQRADGEAARGHLERAAAHDRSNRAVWERWATLDYMEGRRSEAARRAGELLAQDPGNVTAYYILGMVHLQEGQADLAEAALRRSLQTRLTAPACHGLAQALLARGRFEEAVGYARQAVAMQPRQPAFWGTLGLVLAARPDGPGAAASFDQALNLGLRDPSVLVPAARVFLEHGQPDKTARLFTYLDPRRDQLPPALRGEYDLVRQAWSARPQPAQKNH